MDNERRDSSKEIKTVTGKREELDVE